MVKKQNLEDGNAEAAKSVEQLRSELEHANSVLANNKLEIAKLSSLVEESNIRIMNAVKYLRTAPFKYCFLSQRIIIYSFLKTGLWLSPLFSNRTIQRFRHSAEKRNPNRAFDTLMDELGAPETLVATKAFKAVCSRDWEIARMEWRNYTEMTWNSGNCITPRYPELNLKQESPNTDIFETATDYGQKPLQNSGKKICVYTAMFGDYDNLPPILFQESGIDYICFTDKDRDIRGWKFVIENSSEKNTNMKAKKYKIFPDKYLSKYEYSIYVDANTVIPGRLWEFVNFCISNGDFLMWKHPKRSDISFEACAIIYTGRYEPEAIINQVETYANKGIIPNSGLIEASLIWRRHHSPYIIEFMKKWWDEILKYSSRDQISLAFLLWNEELKPKVFPDYMGDARRNTYFCKIPHIESVKSRNELQKRASGEFGNSRIPTAPQEIVFLYNPALRESGSTILRGKQLSHLAAQWCQGEREVRFSEDTNVRDCIVILTKSFLQTTTEKQLDKLAVDNILLADFVDLPPVEALVEHIDVLMASSLTGYLDYLTDYPNTPCFHITHHIDTRLPIPDGKPNSSFSCAYFGELVNTIIDKNISSFVKFHRVNTKRQDSSWMDHVGDANFHYAVRSARSIDGHKPFLKGFVAAHYGANMMIQKSTGDTEYYLGNDYPYLISQDSNIKEIRDMLEYAKESFGSRDWKFALEIMREVKERSSVDHVKVEFLDMVSKL
ncbi:MAG: DUF616 domain-containing protein [Lentisphaerae bacterium]|nr:DUF616 domain-containing protein [Lentisphaerota bacterium]